MLDEETIKNITNSYLVERLRVRDIADKYSIHTSTIYRILSRLGREKRGLKTITSDTEERVVRLYNSSAHIADIMEMTGIKGKQTVYRILRDNGVR